MKEANDGAAQPAHPDPFSVRIELDGLRKLGKLHISHGSPNAKSRISLSGNQGGSKHSARLERV